MAQITLLGMGFLSEIALSEIALSEIALSEIFRSGHQPLLHPPRLRRLLRILSVVILTQRTVAIQTDGVLRHLRILVSRKAAGVASGCFVVVDGSLGNG